jgi:hypothetical protein
MSSALEEMLQQLRVVIGELDRAAVTVTAAQHHATVAAAAFDEAATGSAHPQMYIARQESRVAADKAGQGRPVALRGGDGVRRVRRSRGSGYRPAAILGT